MTALEQVAERLASWTIESKSQEKRLDILIAPNHLLEAVAAIKDWGYFSAIVGLDERENLAVLYVFCSGDSLLSIKVRLSSDKPQLPSIYSLIPASLLQERELQEMFGITLQGIPDTSHLLLPDEWPDELYPLRKDALLD
jgi:Ni,Fe-hydrogenase III component G